jgi:hypothetical protein
MLCPALNQKRTCSHCPKIKAEWDMNNLILVMERAKGVFKAVEVNGYRAKAAELNIIDISNPEDFAKLNIQSQELSGVEKCVLHLLLFGVLSKQEISQIVCRAESTITSEFFSRGLFRYAEIIAKVPDKRINHDNFRTFIENCGYRKNITYIILSQDVEHEVNLEKFKNHVFNPGKMIFYNKEGGK